MGYNCYMRLQFFASGFDVPDRVPALPPARDFVLSAGFGGAAALIAALVIALIAVLVARGITKRHRAGLEQQERHHREVREQEQRAAAIARCWQRLVWVVETAGLEPASETATLGLGPELALEVLRGLLRDAERLGDDTLAGAVTVHLSQFSLVLAQQGGALAELIAPSAAAEVAADDAPAAVAQKSGPPAASRTVTTDDSSAEDDGAVVAKRRAAASEEPASAPPQRVAVTRGRRRAR
jgi:hypothetical protein